MDYLKLIVFFLFISNISFCQIPADSLEKPLSSVTEKPVFKGNYLKFVSKNLQYPKEAALNNISGPVVVEYIVEKDGSVSNIKLIESVGYGCDEAALKMINLMSKNIIPAKNNGVIVRYKEIQRIPFILPEY